MAIADGITGTVDDLQIDSSYVSNTQGLPVDMLLIDLTDDSNADLSPETLDSSNI